MCRSNIVVALLVVGVAAGADDQDAASTFEPRKWSLTGSLPAPEAHQAAAADEKFVYAITNTRIARYDRKSGKRLSVSTGGAQHINSGFLWEGKLLCAHSNYPKTPEISEIKSLNLESPNNGKLLVTGHDDPLLFRLRIQGEGLVLEFVDTEPVPFIGQGFAVDTHTGGLVGINRSGKQVVFAAQN